MRGQFNDIQHRLTMAVRDILGALFRCEDAVSQLDFRVKSKPTLRNHPRHTGDLWMQGKRIDDDIDANLWRIHDGLYDFANFIDQHPGGPDWLRLTKGSDITEAFEAHHISVGPEKMLQKYFVRKATTQRNSPFTFEEDGFYRTLKRNVREFMKREGTKSSSIPTKSDFYTDLLCASYFALALSAAWFGSFALAMLAGLALSLTTIAAHNYFHRKDNFRMYYFDLSMMSSRSWRITHALSHHIYTNTIYDYEISFVEPFFQFLPTNKPLFVRYASWCYAPLVYAGTFPASYIRMLLQVYADGVHTFRPEALLPFIAPMLMCCMAHTSFLQVGALFGVTLIVASVCFSTVGLNAAHHHPLIFHDGDQPQHTSIDWGLHQLDAVADRSDINSCDFLVLTNFGEHSLHHLFPTLDHGVLKTLHPVVIETCRQFGTDIQMYTQLELVRGQFLQLARTHSVPHDLRKRVSG